MQSAEELIIQFKQYCESHPNLANCWIAYLGLKKRHWRNVDSVAIATENQALKVLNSFENGSSDLNKNDILSVLLYKQVMMI